MTIKVAKMTKHDDVPDIIFSDLTQAVMIDGHRFMVEIFRTSEDHSWVLSVENEFGTLTISDNPPFLGDTLAWRAFEEMVRNEGVKTLFSKKEQRALGI